MTLLSSRSPIPKYWWSFGGWIRFCLLSLWIRDTVADHILLRIGGGRTSVPGLRGGSCSGSIRPTSTKAKNHVKKFKLHVIEVFSIFVFSIFVLNITLFIKLPAWSLLPKGARWISSTFSWCCCSGPLCCSCCPCCCCC